MSFREYAPATVRIPLRGDVGLAYAAELGALQDEELALLRTALLSRLASRCPVDALEAVGRGYALARYSGEDDERYRARLMIAWPTRRAQGSAQAVEEQMRAVLGTSDVRVYDDDELRPFGAGRWYSRFVVVIGPDLGALVLDDAEQRRALKAIALRWKAAHGYAAALLIRSTDAPVLGIDFTLGVSPLGGTATVPVMIGRLLGVNTILGTTPLGGYDRS